jgi:hypothetical protein
MGFLDNLDFWRYLAVGIALLDIAGLGLFVWLGFIDELDNRRFGRGDRSW